MQEQGTILNLLNQGNKSAITLMEKVRSTSQRTKYISDRYFFVKDRINSVEYVVFISIQSRCKGVYFVG